MAVATAPSASEPKARAAPAGKRPPLHIPSLDGLRAVSFFFVFAAHAGLERFVPGGFGVTVFFFLSGYLITTLMRVEAERSGHVNLKNFYLRRALRILPPFYIVLLGAIALSEVGFLRGQGPPRAMPIASQLLHFSNYWIAERGWSGIPPGTGVYWSLAVEEHFYLVFPTVFLLLGRLHLTGRQQALAFWGVCAAVLAWRCILVFALDANVDRTYLCSDTRVDSIAFGCALAVWRNPALDDRPDPGPRAGVLPRVLLVAALALLLVTFVVRDPAFRETFRYTLQGVALTPLFALAVRWPRWLSFRPLNWKPLRFVGTLSYSLYLIHQVVLATVEQHTSLPGVPRAAVALVVASVLAWVMYVAVEKPCARLRRRISSTEP
jgi:peptidoglycan/LPS O-acetylase OafA/YrhL